MDRRTLLAASGSALSTGLGGCLGDVSGPRQSNAASSPCDVALNGPGPDADRIVDAWSWNDVPPYEIADPAYPEDAEDADDWNQAFLGEHMPTDPSIAFVPRSVSRDRVREPPEFTHGTSNYVVELIENDDHREAVLEGGNLDFEENVLVLVGDCCGSSSVEHRWARIEATASGVHLYGYLTEPWRRTADLSPRYSLLQIDRPADDVDHACVSLTADTDSRVHFDSTDGVVSLVSGVVANDRSEALDVRLRITTTDDETRVDDTFTLQAKTEWRGIGLIGEVTETFTVEVDVDALDVDVTEEYPAERGTLGIRIERGGEAVIGRSNEI